MAIEFKDEDLLAVLDRAIQIARSDQELPRTWLRRLSDLDQLKSNRTFIAALGAALLARATNENIDCFTHKSDQGQHSYQLRPVAEFLAKHNKGRYHLGSTSEKNPVNASTLIKSDRRLNELKNIKAKETYALFVDCLSTLNEHTEDEALLAFAAFLRLRMQVAETAEAEARRLGSGGAKLSLDELVEATDLFVCEDPEGGRRGQAFVAALLDCVYPGVELQKINSPHPGDVRVVRSGVTHLAVEVKQVEVTDETGINLAREALAMGAEAALLVAIGRKQRPLNREHIVHTAIRKFGVAVAVAHTIQELVTLVAAMSGGRTRHILEKLPNAYLRRLIEHDSSTAGRARWCALMTARGTSIEEK